MHGIVMKAMKDFVVDTYDEATWRAIQEEAGLGGKLYVPVSEYDDAEALAEGIIDGVAEFYGESYVITHETCQLDGDPHCDFVVARAGASASAH